MLSDSSVPPGVAYPITTTNGDRSANAVYRDAVGASDDYWLAKALGYDASNSRSSGLLGYVAKMFPLSGSGKFWSRRPALRKWAETHVPAKYGLGLQGVRVEPDRRNHIKAENMASVRCGYRTPIRA